jgi:mitochondrial fission protein ELM1
MNILWIKDGKKGHEKQVKVLLDEISKNIDIKIFEEDYLISSSQRYLDIFDHATNYLMAGKQNWPHLALLEYKKQNIDTVIGAGSNVYTRMVLIKKALRRDYSKNIKAVSVLVPTFFQKEFDIICAPNHDNHKLPNKRNIIFYEGSLAQVSDRQPDKELGFIGIGGENKHYIFDQKKILSQIEYVLSLHSNMHWALYTSRRTPKELIQKIKILKNKFSNLELAKNDIDEAIRNSAIKVVTQDSVNMVFECLSTKGDTYLFNMKFFKKNKIVILMHNLLENKQVGYVEYSKMVDGLHKMKMINRNKYSEIFAEVEKVSFELLKRISQ